MRYLNCRAVALMRGCGASLWQTVPKAITALLLTGCTWNNADRLLAADLLACEALDVAQTRWVLHHDGQELNRYAYGSPNPSTGRLIVVKLVGLSTFGALVNYYPKGRSATLAVGDAVCIGAVGWNYHNGARAN